MKTIRHLLTFVTIICTLATTATAQTFPIVFDFSSTSDTSGTYTAALQNGASLETFASQGVLDLGQNDGYLDLGAEFGAAVHTLSGDFTISVTLFIPSETNISANGNFVWCLSKSSNSGYLFLSAKDTRYAITLTNWGGEASVGASRQMAKGEWLTVTYVREGTTGTLYIGTEAVASNTAMQLSPANIDALGSNYLGRSCYSGDAYLRGARYADFRVYDRAVTPDELTSLSSLAYNLNNLPADVALAMDADALVLPSSINNLYEGVSLPSQATYGSSITWQSSDTSLLTDDGLVVAEGVEAAPDTRTHVTLTATLTNETSSTTKTFDVWVHKKDSPYSHYLFTFFPSNFDENIYYAVSDNGYDYTTVNKARPVVKAQGITVMNGLRDPHILRGEDGLFYMVATDMCSALGWSSNRGMVLMRSSDLIHWQTAMVHFPTRYKGTYLANVTRVWAPETIYDHETGKYMIYFSILTSDGVVKYDKVFYAYANEDFTDLEGEPIYLYDRGSATIDMNIVFNENDSLYHGFYKNEGTGGICKVTASRLTMPAGQEGKQWSLPSGTLQQTSESVEGAGVFRRINSDEWILMYDCYMNGHYQFCSSPDLSNFTFCQNTVTQGAFTPRHGTVIPITEDEYQCLINLDTASSISSPATSSASSAHSVFFTLSGQRISRPTRGITIQRSGNTTQKVIVQ
ncbi:MAG: hypothetical protein J5486_00840 [Bacteroidaceae bacterium]|nr:hypothetical protein [Bacteroidaceae bacterium]